MRLFCILSRFAFHVNLPCHLARFPSIIEAVLSNFIRVPLVTTFVTSPCLLSLISGHNSSFYSITAILLRHYEITCNCPNYFDRDDQLRPRKVPCHRLISYTEQRPYNLSLLADCLESYYASHVTSILYLSLLFHPISPIMLSLPYPSCERQSR